MIAKITYSFILYLQKHAAFDAVQVPHQRCGTSKKRDGRMAISPLSCQRQGISQKIARLQSIALIAETEF